MSHTTSRGRGRRSLFSLSLRKGSGLSTTGQWLFQGHLGRCVRPARSTSHGDGPKSYWPDLIYSGSLHEQAHSVVAPRQPQAEPQRLKHDRNCHFCDLTPGQQMFRFPPRRKDCGSLTTSRLCIVAKSGRVRIQRPPPRRIRPFKFRTKSF